MQRMRFLGLAWSVAACCSLTAAAAHTRVADRPTVALYPLDGYCCPYGLGQWQGRPHRSVYGDSVYGDAMNGDAVNGDSVHRDGDDPSPKAAAPRPFVVDETRSAVGTQTPPRDFYDDVDGSNFDRPQLREPPAAATEDAAQDATPNATPSAAPNAAEDTAQNHAACRGEEPCETEPFCEMPADGDSPLRSLEESLADWRHSAGQFVVQHLNAESDGLDETEAGELDWAAIASQMEGHEAAGSVKGAADAAERTGEGSRESKEEEDAEGKDGDWFSPRRRDRDSVPPVQPPPADEDDTYHGPYHRWEGRQEVEPGIVEPGVVDPQAVDPQTVDRSHDECRGDGCDVRPNSWDVNDEPGRLRQWCGHVWGALRHAAQDVSRRLGQLSEEVLAAPTPPGDQEAGHDEAGHDETDNGTKPQTEATRPPLPDYFLPAFGSPWDGDL